jgi:hypothetical protein
LHHILLARSICTKLAEGSLSTDISKKSKENNRIEQHFLKGVLFIPYLKNILNPAHINLLINIKT